MDANNAPTVFTDDSLKFMKESFLSGTGFTLDPEEGKALLDRLEAAENFIEVGALSQGVSISKLAVAELRWRQSAGKEL